MSDGEDSVLIMDAGEDGLCWAEKELGCNDNNGESKATANNDSFNFILSLLEREKQFGATISDSRSIMKNSHEILIAREELTPSQKKTLFSTAQAALLHSPPPPISSLMMTTTGDLRTRSGQVGHGVLAILAVASPSTLISSTLSTKEVKFSLFTFSLSHNRKFPPDRESNPGLPRDRRRSSPLDYRGIGGWEMSKVAQEIVDNENTPQRHPK